MNVKRRVKIHIVILSEAGRLTSHSLQKSPQCSCGNVRIHPQERHHPLLVHRGDYHVDIVIIILIWTDSIRAERPDYRVCFTIYLVIGIEEIIVAPRVFRTFNKIRARPIWVWIIGVVLS